MKEELDKQRWDKNVRSGIQEWINNNMIYQISQLLLP